MAARSWAFLAGGADAAFRGAFGPGHRPGQRYPGGAAPHVPGTRHDGSGGGVFCGWGGSIAQLAEIGVICFKVQEEKAYRLCPDFTPLTAEAAETELARRYFTHYGPATLRDAAYFFHCPQTKVKAWLARLPAQTVTVEGRTYFYLTDAEPKGKMPPVVFLGGFDQLMLGYRKEDNPFLPPEYLRGIFNLAGIVAPAVLLHGRVAGRWKRQGKKLTVTLFETVSPEDRKRMEAEAIRLWPEAAIGLEHA